MAEEGKKISFGFSKSIKKPVLKNVAPKEEKKVDYIECVDEKSIKIIGGEEKEDKPLVIPMLGSKTWHERIVNKVDADIFEAKIPDAIVKNDTVENVQIKQEEPDTTSNGDISNENSEPMDVTKIKTEPPADQSLTLEEQAAQEIIADLKSSEGKTDEQKVFAVPITNDDLRGKEESSLEDYENIPIEQFGMAMLRGMGWQPGKGIGKNEKVVPPAIPELRPKGMGLGADKVAKQNPNNKSTKDNEQLKLVKDSYIKVTAGKHSGSYGKIEGFDEDAARIILKLALGGETISVNECYVQPVTATEYSQNSKVLNVKRYEEYKSNESSKTEKVKCDSPKSDEDNNAVSHKSRHREKSKKKLKKRRHQSSSNDSSTERKSRRKRDSSHSDGEYQKSKKSKKSKKRRDSSSERSSRKNRKKDKEREKTKDKKSDYSNSSERARHKHRRRSRSRSRSRSYSPKNRKRDRSHSHSPRR